jgi:flagellar protein FlgJ
MGLQPAAFAAMAAMGPAVARARPDAAPADHASGARAGEAMRVGRQFERMFLSQMLAPIFDTIRTDGPFGGGHAESMMRSFQVDAYAASIVGKGGIGLAPRIAAEILRMQENSNG